VPTPRRADPARVEQLLGVLEAALVSRLPGGRGMELAAELRERLEVSAGHLLDGVNPAREDASPRWDEARAAAYAPTEHTGAVHLEVGVWTAFGAVRTEELRAGDGLAEFIRLDSDPEVECDVVADAESLPFAAGSIDRVASNSVLEHTAHPQRVVEETLRVLRPGGVMVVVVPSVWWLHGYPHDYVRLTPMWFQRVCREVGFAAVEVDVDTSGGLYNVLHNVSKHAAVTAGRPETDAMRELHELAITLLGALVPFDRFFEDGARSWFHSVRVLARAPGRYEPRGRDRGSGDFASRTLDLLAAPRTKAPLERARGHLVDRGDGAAYPVDAAGRVDFLHPSAVPSGPGERLRGLESRLRARARRTS